MIKRMIYGGVMSTKKKYLADAGWMVIGSTDYYNNLKEDIQYVCEDLYESSSIKEIMTYDILQTLRLHGFEVVQVDSSKINYSIKNSQNN